MKKVLAIGGGLLAVIALAVGLVFYLTADMAETAVAFFTAVKAKDYAAAAEFLSEDFRASTPQPQLAAFFEQSAMAGFKAVNWDSRSFSGSQGELVGTIVSESGGVVPISVHMVKENGRWRIYSLRKQSSGLTADGGGTVPIEAEQRALVQDSMSRLAAAVNSADFTDFHGRLATAWRKEISPEGLQSVFHSFIENRIDLTGLERLNPLMEPAALAENGVLTIKGHYPTMPSRVLFQFGYIYEGVTWKLVQTKVDLVAQQ